MLHLNSRKVGIAQVSCSKGSLRQRNDQPCLSWFLLKILTKANRLPWRSMEARDSCWHSPFTTQSLGSHVVNHAASSSPSPSLEKYVSSGQVCRERNVHSPRAGAGAEDRHLGQRHEIVMDQPIHLTNMHHHHHIGI